jgi:hypothetical protein
MQKTTPLPEGQATTWALNGRIAHTSDVLAVSENPRVLMDYANDSLVNTTLEFAPVDPDAPVKGWKCDNDSGDGYASYYIAQVAQLKPWRTYGCGQCHTCLDQAGQMRVEDNTAFGIEEGGNMYDFFALNPASQMMIVCSLCGNKRCPHANNHENSCTQSNEPGQAGSAYENVPSMLAGTAVVNSCAVCGSTDDVRWNGMSAGAWLCREHKDFDAPVAP